MDDQAVSAINGALEEDIQIKQPMKLKAWKGRFSEGQHVMGRGFELTVEERAEMLAADPSCAEVIFPLFNGQDLNTMPRLEPYRWVIYFRDWSEEKARQYGAAFRRVEDLVRPYRDALTGQIHQDCFWKFWDLRPRLIHEVARNTFLLAQTILAKHIAFRRVPSQNIYNKRVKLYFLYEWSDFAVLQSTLHREWAWWTSGTVGLAGLNYSTSSSFDTWSMPAADGPNELDSLGERYHEHRAVVMADEGIGLTQFYNRFHDPSDADSRIGVMRGLHREIDLAVARAYRWDDLDLEHGFHKVPYLPEYDRVRFTISDRVRLEVLRRLSELNHQRYEDEVAQGLHGSGGTRAPSRARRAGRTTNAAPSQPSLDFDARATVDGENPATAILGFLSAHAGWHAKADVLAASGITGGQWNAAIADLIVGGKVERQGIKRGARYSIHASHRDAHQEETP